MESSKGFWLFGVRQSTALRPRFLHKTPELCVRCQHRLLIDVLTYIP
jgi:hypothetical protein